MRREESGEGTDTFTLRKRDEDMGESKNRKQEKRAVLDRRDTLKMLIGAPLAAGMGWTSSEVMLAAEKVARSQESEEPFQAQFFNDHEYATVRVLVDLVIPSDDRSGSATEAAVPEFMDFILTDKPEMQTSMRGGLAWLDAQCLRLHDSSFLQCSDEQRRGVLDRIAYPDSATPEWSHGVRFFNSFRDLTASGFWTSEMGIEDLGYQGNVFVSEWKGCPQQALDKLGVSYDD